MLPVMLRKIRKIFLCVATGRAVKNLRLPLLVMAGVVGIMLAGLAGWNVTPGLIPGQTLTTIIFPGAQAADDQPAAQAPDPAPDAEIAAGENMDILSHAGIPVAEPGWDQNQSEQNHQNQEHQNHGYHNVIDDVMSEPDAGQSRINAGRLGGLRAVIKARRQAMLSSQLSARILKIGPEDGERFEKGHILVTFDCEDFRAQLDKMQAELFAAEEKYASTEQLNRMGGISTLDVSAAKAATKSAKADVRAASWKVNRCHIKAPYDGRVVERIANRYETVNVGDDIMSIVSDSDLEVRVIMPSAWLRRVGMGTLFLFNLEETGQSYEAEVVATGAKIDPVSQTVEMRGRILSTDNNVIAGMSGSALFDEFIP